MKNIEYRILINKIIQKYKYITNIYLYLGWFLQKSIKK